MTTYHLHLFAQLPAALQGGVVTVGNFDGVHRGHMTLVRANRRLAETLGVPAIAATFDPPPLSLLYPPAVKPPLSTLRERAALLHAAGVDAVVALHTDAALLSLNAESFFEDVLLGQFRARGIVEGFNFRFGRARSGDGRLLRELCLAHGVPFVECPSLVCEGGFTISSSRIREALKRGDVVEARQLLGRSYGITGVVETGAQRGRTIGFPTANLGGVPTMLPLDGVYAVRVDVDGTEYRGAMNIGPNPTFAEQRQKLEVHLLDFQGDLYGRELRVTFTARLRDTTTFPNLEALVAQLHRDVARARTEEEP